MSMVRHDIRVTGRVQGVGFRYTAMRAAADHPDVTGWVRNEPDGSVRCVVEGETAALDAFLADLRGRMEGNIDDVSITAGDATGEFEIFEVRR